LRHLPKEITGIEPRLTSASPAAWLYHRSTGSGMRVAILLQKSAATVRLSAKTSHSLSPNSTFQYSELEVALNRIEAFARFHKRAITIDLAKEALKIYWRHRINRFRSKHPEDSCRLLSHQDRRIAFQKTSRVIARPRQIAMTLARELTQLSLPEIGNAFGDVTTLPYCMPAKRLSLTQQRFCIEFWLQPA